jgi:hypothetical protein
MHRDGERHAGAVLSGLPLSLNRNGPSNQLDVDAAVLHRLDGASDCGARLGIGIGAGFSMFHF